MAIQSDVAQPPLSTPRYEVALATARILCDAGAGELNVLDEPPSDEIKAEERRTAEKSFKEKFGEWTRMKNDQQARDRVTAGATATRSCDAGLVATSRAVPDVQPEAAPVHVSRDVVHRARREGLLRMLPTV